jgi:putative component of membrane protein insertase Oxa1/YidC/SpoIIIJ protein YidD
MKMTFTMKTVLSFFTFTLFSTSVLCAKPTSLADSSEAVGVYQRVISPLLSGDCRSFPSCSAFAQECFATMSRSKAIISTSDRLIRCGNDHTLPRIYKGNGIYYFDPVVDSTKIFTHINFLPLQLPCIDEDEEKRLLKFYELGFFEKALANASLLNTKVDCSDDILVFKSRCARNLGMSRQFIKELSEGYLLSEKLRNEYYQVLFDGQSFDQIKEISLQIHSPNSLDRTALFMAEIMNGNFDNASVPPDEIIWSDMELNAWETFLNEKNKSPGLAGLLGIIPGLGYAYVGQPKSTLSELVMVGLFASASYEQFRAEQYTTAFLTGIVTSALYLGGIHGPRKKAAQLNHQRRRHLVETLRYRFN